VKYKLRFGERALVAAAGVTLGLVSAHPAWSRSIKVMDPEEVGDSALIARAKAQKRAEQGLPGQGGENTSSDGCSDINIGTFQAKPGQLVPRKIVNVIEGPIIQENKCK
jgi:hypothetical protein